MQTIKKDLRFLFPLLTVGINYVSGTGSARDNVMIQTDAICFPLSGSAKNTVGTDVRPVDVSSPEMISGRIIPLIPVCRSAISFFSMPHHSAGHSRDYSPALRFISCGDMFSCQKSMSGAQAFPGISGTISMFVRKMFIEVRLAMIGSFVPFHGTFGLIGGSFFHIRNRFLKRLVPQPYLR